MKTILKKLLQKFGLLVGMNTRDLYDLILHKEYVERIKNSKNPLNQFGAFGFSQNDEDGIIREILRRIGLRDGFFVEYGVGDGLENNTLALLALGWQGAWFGGENIKIKLGSDTRLKFEKTWITRDNIGQLFKSLKRQVDLISLDLDGNDIFLIEKLLTIGASPKVFIIEYNAKFPPPIEFRIDYNPDHIWASDDYYGASLASFVSVFEKHNYKLVCCSISGTNAFFVHNSLEKYFTDVPTDIHELFSEPFYFLKTRKMHPTSPRTIEKFIKK